MFATAEWVHWFNNTRPRSTIGMHAPIEHEQAYTPPPQEDTNTIAEAMDVGEQTTTSQPQPASAVTRQDTLHKTRGLTRRLV
ncbi:hypothetical protein [Actinomyces procaprae]|uniref:hypothetical protein n=1 Tax=Actinomyces procaprae TaxID=2560010 RepID=UPI00109D8371|nr:hypothetical protein [Actinomyces procaprae]